MPKRRKGKKARRRPASETKRFATKLAKKLRHTRKRRNLTLYQLSRRTKLSVAALSQYETAHSVPSSVSLYSLCRALKITPNRLLDWK